MTFLNQVWETHADYTRLNDNNNSDNDNDSDESKLTLRREQMMKQNGRCNSDRRSVNVTTGDCGIYGLN